MPAENPEPPGNKSHLEKLIDAWSKTPDGLSPGRLRRLVAVVVLAEMLDSLSGDEGPRLVFKGGAGLELRFGATARTSRDVDALTTIGIDDAFIEIADRVKVGWSGFTGTVGERTEIVRAGITPLPERAKIKLRYKGKDFDSIAFELGHLDAGSFQLDLTPVRLSPDTEIHVLGVHYQIAQKLHACTEVPAEGVNARVHDLYDILLLESLAREDGLAKTRAACEATFAERAKHSWPPVMADWEDWPAAWAAIDVHDDLRYDYQDARLRVIELINDITGA